MIRLMAKGCLIKTMLPSQIICQNRYQLIQQLGENQGRQTWLASDLSQGNQVVVKLLAFSPQMEWEQLKLFEREAEVLQRLNHPKIPKYRDYFSLEKEEGDGLCWFGLVQDFIPGISLQQLITQGKKFTESQIKDIATQVLEILIYLHKLAPQILHRDIKPSNLLLGEDNQIYLLDFGAVQNLGAVEGVTFTVVGTTGYAPLEQFWGKTVPASDLYALGATIIHLLTGISPADLPQEKLRIKFADRVSVNRAFVQWVEGMTEPDPHQRYQTALSALKDLKAGRFLKDTFQLITSPFGEKVILAKSHQELKIVLPIPEKYRVYHKDVVFIKGVRLLLLCLLGGVFLVCWLFILFCFCLGFITTPLAVVLQSPLLGLLKALYLLLFSLVSLFVVAQLGYLLWGSVRSLVKSFLSTDEYCIHFDREQFVIKYQRAGKCLDREEGKTPEINDCQLTDSAIAICARNKRKYIFGDGVGERERKWIVTEIREWLQESKN